MATIQDEELARIVAHPKPTTGPNGPFGGGQDTVWAAAQHTIASLRKVGDRCKRLGDDIERGIGELHALIGKL